VWAAPASERTPFPENHSPYLRRIALRTRPKLKGHDVALVIGAPVFRYYPYVPGPYLPAGLRLPHISDDPAETARAPVGDSLIGDAVLTLVGLRSMRFDPQIRCLSRRAPKSQRSAQGMADHRARYLLHLCERGLGWNLPGLALGKWRALLKERGAFHGQAAATVREGICGRSRSVG
jgi:thiamine pyrophosphate-dependent acetolactate synthase large subunit-like protein